jgi:hypothetical protein
MFIAELFLNEENNTIRAGVLEELVAIYHGAVEGEDMTDNIADELNSYFDAVENSNDPVLQKVYSYVMDQLPDTDPDIQATGTLKAIRKLTGDAAYTPPPKPLPTPDQQKAVDDFVNRFASGLASRGVKAHPDWNKDIKEVTLVPSVAKSKREHLDVMPNDGRPIPSGEESEYLGDLVAEMGKGYQLWSWTDRGTVTYYVFDTETRTSQLGTTGRPYKSNPDSFVVQGVYSGPKNQYRAADLYAFLILNRGLTLVSDNKQSAGGYRVWQELEQRYGKKLNIHGFDTKTNEPVNVTTKDEPETHVARADIKKAGPQMKRELGSISRDLRFVASAK